jgi:hypothetical protein
LGEVVLSSHTPDMALFVERRAQRPERAQCERPVRWSAEFGTPQR